LKVDFKNAFNNISRDVFLSRVIEDFPDVAHWAWFCYSNPSSLWYFEEPLSSEEGVQQGDPLGPMLFSLALHGLVLDIAKACPDLAIHCWYLDDGCIGGTAAQIATVISLIDALGPRYGLFLAQTKSELIFHARPTVDLFPSTFLRRYGDFDLLGTPIGSDSYVHDWLERKVLKKCGDVWASVGHLQDKHVAYCVLRSCCSFQRLVHVLRTVPPLQCYRACIAFDRNLRASFVKTCSVTPDDAQWSQACLSVSRGGLGFRRTVSHRSAAYLGSVIHCAHLDSWDPTSASDFDASVADFNSRVRRGSELDAPLEQSQRDLSAAVEEADLATLIEAATSQFQRARLRSVSSGAAGHWAHATPNRSLGLAFNDAEFVTLVSWWLGVALPGGTKCPTCRKHVTDKHGYHQLTCRWAGSLGVRHNAIRDVLFKAMRAAGWSVATEVNIFPTGQQRAADILRRTDVPVAFDVAVTHGLQPAYLAETSAAGPHAAARYACDHKDAKYKERADREGVRFVPLVCDVHGNWTVEAMAVFKDITRDIAARISCSPGRQLSHLLQRLGVLLQRANARAILLRSVVAWECVEGDGESPANPPFDQAGLSSDVEEEDYT
jgi:ubiquitin carboxyl-terminal hydrolase 44/49